MGIFRKRGPSIPELKQQAANSMDAALLLFENLLDEVKDEITIEVEVFGIIVPIKIRIKVDEEEPEE